MKRITYSLLALVLAIAVAATWESLPAKAQNGDEDDQPAADQQQEQAEDDPGAAAGVDGGDGVILHQFGGGFGGLGGGGFGGGGFGGGGQFINVGVVQSPSTVVVISEDKQRAAAYSARLGEWHVQTLKRTNDPNVQPVPVVGQQLASVAVGNRVYAYSAVTGNWEELKFPVGAENPVVHNGEYLSVTHGEMMSMFSARAGKWATINTKQAKTVNWRDEKAPE